MATTPDRHLVFIAVGEELELEDRELLSRVNEQIFAGKGRTGRFNATARYHAGQGLTENLRELDPAAWTGTLVSNVVVIDIR